MIGEAVLGLGEAGVVFDNSAAVGVGDEEEADRLDHGWGLRVLADCEVGDGSLLEVWDRFAFGVEDRGPGGVDWCGSDEGGRDLGSLTGLLGLDFGAMGIGVEAS